MATPSYEGVTGGKFRKRPLRRTPSTPYDRPPSAARGLRVLPAEAEGNSWLSKLVDPASRFITGSASRIFSSVFRKRLAAPPAALENHDHSRQEAPEVTENSDHSRQEAPEVVGHDQGYNSGDNPTNNSNTDGISELEQLLKQKTFTRVEFDHLTELLRSRTVEPVTLEPVVNDDKKEKEKETPENIAGKSRLYFPKDDAAWPEELAKAYMGSRPSKVSPSNLSMRSQVFQEDADAALPTSIVPYVQKPFDMSVAPRSVVRFSGISELPENGYLTPKPRGRSTMCRMSCSPYFKVHPTTNAKVGGPIRDDYTGPSSSQRTPRNAMHSSGKQVLKRESSVLDGDFGSFGPIRRVRQKSYLMSSTKDSRSTQFNKDAFRGSTSVHKPRLDDKSVENGENKMLYASVTPIPPKSSETAMKILQQLDKLVPSPKEKSSEPQAFAREESTSKFFNVQGSGSLDTNHDSELLSLRSSPSGEQKKVEENGPSKPAVSGVNLSAEACIVDSIALRSTNANPGTGTADFVISGSAALPPRENSVFKMSASEDSLVLDDDNYKTVAPVREADRRASGSSAVAEKYAGFTFHVAPAPSTHYQPPPTPAMSTASFDRSASPNERTDAPVFSFGSVASRPLTFSSTMATVTHSACQKVSASNATTAATIEGSILDKGGEMEKFTDLSKSFENAVTSGMPTSTASVFGFATSTTPRESNGSASSSSLTFPVPATPSLAPSDSRVSLTFSTGSATTSTSSPSISSVAAIRPTVGAFQFGSSTSISVSRPVNISVKASTSTTNSSTAPFTSAFSNTGSGSSSTLRTPSSFSSSDSGSSALVTSVAFSSIGSSSSALTPASTFSSTGKGIFGFSASAQPSTLSLSFTNNGSQISTATFGAAAGSLFGAQSTQSGSGISHFSQSSTSQLGPLFSSTFGASNQSSSGFGSSPLGSATSGAKSLTSSGFPFTGGSGSSSLSFFSPSSQPSTSSVFGFSSDSQAPTSSGFSIGQSSSASGSSSSSFGSLTGPVLSFTSASNPSRPAFAMPTPAAVFSSGSPGNDQMNVEDSMSDDTNQAAVPMASTFGQPAGSAAPPNLVFGSTAPAGPPVFQFGSHPTPSVPQIPSPFQAGNLEFTPGGNFSLGSGGGDKSGRRFIKVKRDKQRKK